MKSIVSLTVFLFALSATYSQNLPVSQAPQLKKAVIEEFTAFRCGNCPAGHELTNDIADNMGEENLLVIGYHVGSLAAPQNSGDPDLRTVDGDAMRTHFGVSGTPSGPVNRGSFGTGNYVLSANNWDSNTAAQHALTADANVALDVTIDPNTREVTINTEIFYTTNSAATHYLTVGYMEEGIIGPQTTYNTNWNSEYFYPNGDYYHRHVFRGFINNAAGDPVDASATGVIDNSFTFVVPTENNGHPININSLEFFAILHEGLNGPTDSEIVNAAKSVDPFVSIEEEEVRKIAAAPNPNNGTFQVIGLESSDEISITDIRGRSVEFVRSNNTIVIDKSGYYILQVSGEEGIGTVRLVVQ